MPEKAGISIFSFIGKMKILHLSSMAFFITFMVWFNHAPLLAVIADSLNLSSAEIKTLLLLNVALTIPARVIIGMLTDKYGPRLVYALLLAFCSIPCFMFAVATDFAQAALSRFLLGLIGAGFVIGVRMVSEWFPANELGTAEGIYGGWGNFGSAAAAMLLPSIALFFGDENGWRYAVAMTGVMSLWFSVIWYRNVQDTPHDAIYFKPKNSGAMQVTNRGDFFLLCLMKLPMYGALVLLVWQLSVAYVGLLSEQSTMLTYSFLFLLFILDLKQTYSVNIDVFNTKVPTLHQYKFKQVAVLNVLYFTTFGSELAVVSMLPLFFAETFTLDMVFAAMLASSYAFMNLMSRPAGGWLSDKFGRKKVLLLLTAGLVLGYFTMSLISATWSLVVAVIIVMLCSFTVQAGEGAIFATVPLIKRSLTGQIAGMTGAYGNVGAVVYLTVLTFVSYSQFFLIIALTAVLGFIILLFMEEPTGSIAEVLDNGTVAFINVNSNG